MNRENSSLKESVVLNGFHQNYKSYDVTPQRNSLRWQNLNVYVMDSVKEPGSMFKFIKQKKQILKNVSGTAPSGETVAILGASGTGKSTLLNALTFRNTNNINVTGSVFFNDAILNQDLIRNISAYVPQEDLFIGTLTVRETLIFQALMRMRSEDSALQRRRRVDEVLHMLQLRKCANTLVGIPGKVKGISGGEKKRLAFGCEILTDPLIMFCDEPTSGLDSFMALKILGVLKLLAKQGKIVVYTIHQPSSHLTEMFDKVVYMASGRIAFQGTVPESMAFLDRLGYRSPMNFNPAEFFIRQIAVRHQEEERCQRRIKHICDSYAASQNTETTGTYVKYNPLTFIKRYDTRKSKKFWIKEFGGLAWRSWVSTMRNPALAKIRFAQTLFVGLLIGLVYVSFVTWRDMNGAMFLMMTSLTFQNVFAVIGVFCCELPIFFREQQNGLYSPITYFISKIITQMPFFAVFAFVFTVPAYTLVGLHMTFYNFFLAAFINILVSLSAISFGYMISVLSPNIGVALTVVPPLLVPLLLCGGFFLNVNSIPHFLLWMKGLSWFSYGFESLVINQWSSNASVVCLYNTTCPKSGEIILKILSFEETSQSHGISGLLFLILLYCSAALAILIVKSRMRKSKAH